MRTTKSLRPFAAITLLLMLGDGPAQQLVSNEVTELPFHERLLGLLREGAGALPESQLNMHPIRAVFNQEAIIPPQCYTRTEGRFNPCYVCHQDPIAGRENTMADGDLQLAYSFSDVGMTNHWANLFEDRRKAVAAISDEEILEWVNRENSSALPPKL